MRSTANLVSGCATTAFAAACAGHRSRLRRRTTERNYAMTTPAKADVDDATKEALTGIALGDLDVLERALELREAWQAQSGLDARAFSLVKIAALIAVDAPPAPARRRGRRRRLRGRQAHGQQVESAGRGRGLPGRPHQLGRATAGPAAVRRAAAGPAAGRPGGRVIDGRPAAAARGTAPAGRAERRRVHRGEGEGAGRRLSPLFVQGRVQLDSGARQCLADRAVL